MASDCSESSDGFFWGDLAGFVKNPVASGTSLGDGKGHATGIELESASGTSEASGGLAAAGRDGTEGSVPHNTPPAMLSKKTRVFECV